MPGWGNLLHYFVALCGVRAWRGDNAAAWLLEVCLALALFTVTSLLPLCDWYPSGYCPGAESQIQINGLEQKEKISIQLEQREETGIQKNKDSLR